MPFFFVTNIRKGKQLLLLIIIAFFTALFFYVEFMAVSPSFSIKGDPKIIYKGEKGLALTFNIGWGDEKAEGIIKTLKHEKVSAATFFLSGSWVERHPHIDTKLACWAIPIRTIRSLRKEKLRPISRRDRRPFGKPDSNAPFYCAPQLVM